MELSTSSKQLLLACISNIRRKKPRPTSVLFSLTYKCQCRCPHCGAALYKKAHRKELVYGEIMRLIEEIKRLGAIWVCFSGGEPLIVQNVIDYIKYAKKQGLRVRLDTNGFLLSENMARKLKRAGLDLIGVSIDSASEVIHESLRGVQGIFRKAIAGIKYCKRNKLECYLGTYATKKNLKNGELKKIIDLGKGLGIPVRILSSILCGNWLNHKELALSRDEIMLLRNLLEKNKVYWEIYDLIDSKEIPFFCMAMNKTLFYISAYGDIQPCSYIPLSFGNTRKEPIQKIIKKMWRSKVFLDYANHRYYDCPFNDVLFAKKIRCR